MSVRFLCTADIHIGRESSGFEAHTALSSWERIVKLAIESRVSAILIAGDLFEDQASQFATRDAVRSSLESLQQAEILAIAVSGNHDYAALPTFCRAYPGLIRLLSADHWDEESVDGVRIVGRSFGKRDERDLLGSLSLPTTDLPTIGLMHADVDSTDGRYNPVPLQKLRVPGIAAWVLGHVHAPKHWDDLAVIYPGSPQALDFGERGLHGLRMLELERSHIRFLDLVPVSSVRYEVDSELVVEDGETIDMAVARRVEETRVGQESICLRTFVRYRGGKPDFGEGLVPVGDDYYEVVGADPFVEVDLLREAEQGDARGQAARLLLGLDGRGEEAWIARAKGAVEDLSRRMDKERRRLAMGEIEDFNVLRAAPSDEATDALRRSLNKVLAATSPGAQ